MINEDLADAIREEIRRILAQEVTNTVDATWLAAEGVDANLSQIEILGETIRFVPKYSHVTGLTNGMTVVCQKRTKETPLTIIGIRSGDITLATT